MRIDEALKRQMIDLAAEARLRARAFSGFHVGAALLTGDLTCKNGIFMKQKKRTCNQIGSKLRQKRN